MDRMKGLIKSLEEGLMSFLSGKPIWLFWIVFTALSGLIFGVFYTLMYLLALRWWGAVIAIIAIGMIWGSLAYTKKVPDIKQGKKEEKKV